MGIQADFLIKHVRPWGNGWALLCEEDPQLRQLLRSWGLTDGDVNGIFTSWRRVVDLDPDDQANEAAFAAVARSVSQTRWDELYTTRASTILFLDAAQIKELSYAASQHPDVDHLDVFITQPAVAAAVTIHRDSDQAEFARPRPTGVEVGTDAGMVSHFWRLLTT